MKSYMKLLKSFRVVFILMLPVFYQYNLHAVTAADLAKEAKKDPNSKKLSEQEFSNLCTRIITQYAKDITEYLKRKNMKAGDPELLCKDIINVFDQAIERKLTGKDITTAAKALETEFENVVKIAKTKPTKPPFISAYIKALNVNKFNEAEWTNLEKSTRTSSSTAGAGSSSDD